MTAFLLILAGLIDLLWLVSVSSVPDADPCSLPVSSAEAGPPDRFLTGRGQHVFKGTTTTNVPRIVSVQLNLGARVQVSPLSACHPNSLLDVCVVVAASWRFVRLWPILPFVVLVGGCACPLACLPLVPCLSSADASLLLCVGPTREPCPCSLRAVQFNGPCNFLAATTRFLSNNASRLVLAGALAVVASVLRSLRSVLAGLCVCVVAASES